MRALLECLPCWLICSLLSLTFASFPLPLSVGRQLLAREGRAQSLVCSCCATTCSYQPWASLIKIWWKFSGLHVYLISGIFPYFQHLPLLSVVTVSFWDLSFPFLWLSGYPSSCFQIKWSRCSSTACYHQPCSR